MTTQGVGPPPYHVTFTMSVEDIVSYLRLLQRRLNMLGVALGVAVAAMGAVIAIVTADLITAVWTIAIGVVLICLAGTSVLDRWRVQRSARSLIGSTATFTIGETGIEADTVTGSGRVEWSSLTQLVQNDKVIVVKRDRIPVVWIPARAFASADEEAAVSKFIQSHIAGGRAQRR